VRRAHGLSRAGLALALTLACAPASAGSARRPLLLMPLADPTGALPAASLRAFIHHLSAGLAEASAWEARLAGGRPGCAREGCARRQGHAAGAVAVLWTELRRDEAGCALEARLLDLRGGPTRDLPRRRGACTDAALRAHADRLLGDLRREIPRDAEPAVARQGPRAAREELRRRVAALTESVFLRGLEARDRVLPALHRHLEARPPDCAALRAAVRAELARLDGWLAAKRPEASDLLRAAAALRARLAAREWARLSAVLEGDVRAGWARLSAQLAEELGASDRMLARLRSACPLMALALTAEVTSALEGWLSALLLEAQSLGLAPGAEVRR